jgi:hypothetical protein
MFPEYELDYSSEYQPPKQPTYEDFILFCRLEEIEIQPRPMPIHLIEEIIDSL